MEKKHTLGLVCTGGGAHGAYQVGVLKYIHEHFSENGRSPFKVFTGASCGALSTSFYAAQSYDAQKSSAWLEELWLSFHVPEYHGNLFKNTLLAIFKEWRRNPEERQTAWSLLDPGPMKRIIEKGFLRKNLERAFHEGSTLGIGIAATELISGRTCWFQEGPSAREWNLFHSIGLIDKLMTDHLASSCSVPIFLPPVKIGAHYFLDGSISLSKPLSAAVSMGATRILSIAAEKPHSLDLPTYKPGFRPRLTKVVGLLLSRLSHDAAEDEAFEIETFNRFYKGLSRKNRRLPEDLEPVPLFHENSRPYHYRETEIFRFNPSRRIRFSSDLDDPRSTAHHKRTRFMFHESFIRELMAMGYSDAAAKHDQLKNFFLPEVRNQNWFPFFGLDKAV